jgi:hypothetical protein
MREFFGLNAPNGYLCYAAVGIPEKEYEVLSRALRPIFKEYESAMVGDSQTNLTEFKFEDFRKMDKEQRVRIAQRLSRTLKQYGVFVVGFYITVQGAVMEQVRSALVGTVTSVPEEHQHLYDQAASELRIGLEGIAQSQTIARILQTPLVCMADFLSDFGCSFQLICDEREKKEDKAVQQAIDGFVRDLFMVAAPQEARLYLGMDNRRSSVNEVGIQLADMMAGEIRMFFEDNVGMLTAESTNELILSDSREAMEWWEENFGIFQKLGALRPIPENLRSALKEPSKRSCLALYRHLLAAGILTCYSNLGQPRHIEILEGNFADQTD